MKKTSEKKVVNLFELDELESRFEMKPWKINIYEPCDCDGDGEDDNVPDPGD